jgi:hypothetical protein
MNYKILVNGKVIAICGHENIENIHLSVSGSANYMYVFASAVCKENGETYFFDWLQHKIKANDKV